MSVRRGNGQNGGHFYSNITQPVKLDCSFIVDSSNANGLGIRSLKSNGYINNVFMHTSATPATNNGYLNPNPASGYAMVQLKNNYNHYLNGYVQFQAPVTGSNINISGSSVMTIGVPYQITALGTSTTANWQTAGVPAGVTPAVGLAYISLITGSGTGTGTVKALGTAGVVIAEILGNTDLSVTSSIGTYSGEFILLKFFSDASTVAAPNNETIVNIAFCLDASSVTIDGL